MKYISILLIAVSVFSCTKTKSIGEDEYVTLSYDQTFCADPWGADSNDTITLNQVSHYLDSVDLYIAALNIQNVTSPETCFACSCKTGKKIYVSTLNSETLKEKYKLLGFK